MLFRSNPLDLGIDRDSFARAMLALPNFVATEGLDYCIASETVMDDEVVARAWSAVESLPREGSAS